MPVGTVLTIGSGIVNLVKSDIAKKKAQSEALEVQSNTVIAKMIQSYIDKGNYTMIRRAYNEGKIPDTLVDWVKNILDDTPIEILHQGVPMDSKVFESEVLTQYGRINLKDEIKKEAKELTTMTSDKPKDKGVVTIGGKKFDLMRYWYLIPVFFIAAILLYRKYKR